MQNISKDKYLDKETGEIKERKKFDNRYKTHIRSMMLRWVMDNIFIRTDHAGNIKADKEKSTEKIAGASILMENGLTLLAFSLFYAMI